jgi:hypothetical protein
MRTSGCASFPTPGCIQLQANNVMQRAKSKSGFSSLILVRHAKKKDEHN